MKGILGYGRYDDDPEHIGCPRAKTDMTPCVARDGLLATFTKYTLSAGNATESNEACVGCGAYPADLLQELVREVTKP